MRWAISKTQLKRMIGMTSIHERLREAAKTESELELKTLLREPECDALVKHKEGLTASGWAADRRNEILAGFIDA